MRFHYFLSVFAILLLARVQADRIATFREYKVVDSPSTNSRTQRILEQSSENDDDIDVTMYVEAQEQLEKLKAEAEEIRDLYHDLMKSAFGLKFNRTVTEPPMLGKPRKASSDWVRSAINPTLFSNKKLALAKNLTRNN